MQESRSHDKAIPEWVQMGIARADPCCEDQHERQKAWRAVRQRLLENIRELESVLDQLEKRAGRAVKLAYASAPCGWMSTCAALVIEALCRSGISMTLVGTEAETRAANAKQLVERRNKFKKLEELHRKVNRQIRELAGLADSIRERDDLAWDLSATVTMGPDILDALADLRNQGRFACWDSAVGASLSQFLRVAMDTSQSGPELPDVLEALAFSAPSEMDFPRADAALLSSQKPGGPDNIISNLPFLAEFLDRLYRLADREGVDEASAKNGLWLSDDTIAKLFSAMVDDSAPGSTGQAIGDKEVKRERDRIVKRSNQAGRANDPPLIFGLDRPKTSG